MSLVQIPGTNYVRDTETMALINRDVNGLEEYKMKRRLISTQKEEINTIKSEMAVLKGDLAEIKKLIHLLLDKDSNGQ